MFKRTIAFIMILMATLCLAFNAEAARELGNGDGRPNKFFHIDDQITNEPSQQGGDNWLIYWYACGTDIETTRILFDSQTDLETNHIVLAEPTRRTGDVTRCIREIERAKLSPKVNIFMQAGGTFIWGHEKFRSNNADVMFNQGVKEELQKYNSWQLPKMNNAYRTFANFSGGKIARYVYGVNERDWTPRTAFAINSNNPVTNMGSKEALIDFLSTGKEIERELYPDGNVRRILIFRDHGGGSLFGFCLDEYSGNMINLKNMKAAFEKVWGTSPETLNNPPFEVIGFDMCQMSTYETAVALEGVTHYMVASQASTIGRVSYDYDAFVSQLSQNPKMSGKELSEMICNTYREDSLKTDSEYNSAPPYRREIRKILDDTGNGISSNEITVSVTDITKMPKLTVAYENFGDALCNTAGDFQNYFITQSNGVFVRSRDKIEQYGGFMVDLKDFAVKFREVFPEVKGASNKLVKALNETVIYNLRGDGNGYYATRYPDGGGLSTYYPLSLTQQRENIISYSSFENLAPNSMKKLYINMYNNNLTTKEIPQPGETNPPGEASPPGDKAESTDTTLPSIKKGSSYDLSDLSEIEPEVDYANKIASIHLSKEQLNRISGVRCQIAWFNYYENDDLTKQAELLFLGGDTNISENWKTGEFKSNFGGKWLSINGNPVFVQVVTEATKKNKRGKIIGGYEIYEVPIILNDHHCTLSISCEYPTETFRILGAHPDSDTNIPVDEIYGINKGDVIKPVYLHLKFSEEDAEKLENATESEMMETIKDKEIISLVAGHPFTIGDSVTIQKETLPDGKYACMFEFVNPVGGSNAYTNPVVFMMTDGQVSSADNVEDIEPEESEN